MTTMPVDNHPLTPKSLQFIAFGVNKLTFKSINIIQTSNNYTIVSGLSAGTPGYLVSDDEKKFRFRG